MAIDLGKDSRASIDATMGMRLPGNDAEVLIDAVGRIGDGGWSLRGEMRSAWVLPIGR